MYWLILMLVQKWSQSFWRLHYGVCSHFFPFFLWKSLTFDYKLVKGNLDDNCSAWLVFSDNLSPYQGNLFHLSDFPRQAVYTWGDNCSTGVIIPDKLSPHEKINGFFISILNLIWCQFEGWKKWLTTPFKVFPRMVRGHNQLFVTI